MRRNRFYVPPEQIYPAQNAAFIQGPEVRYLSRVLRLGPGDRVRIFNGQGEEYLAQIQELSGQRVRLALEELLETQSTSREADLSIVLCQGIPKGDKMELILQKGTELGVMRFIPLLTERTIVQLAEARVEKRQQRWQRVAAAASRQCQRVLVPQVETARPLTEVLESIPPGELGLIPWENETEMSLKKVIRNWIGSPPPVWVFIGPEGGFTTTEVHQARKAGVIPVSLGPRILRTETAGLAVLSLLLYEWGDLGGG